jgi:hypothetical protein
MTRMPARFLWASEVCVVLVLVSLVVGGYAVVALLLRARSGMVMRVVRESADGSAEW